MIFFLAQSLTRIDSFITPIFINVIILFDTSKKIDEISRVPLNLAETSENKYYSFLSRRKWKKDQNVQYFPTNIFLLILYRKKNYSGRQADLVQSITIGGAHMI